MMALLQSPAWNVIKSETNERIGVATKALIDVLGSDTGRVMELQSQIKAMRWLLEWPVTMASQAQALSMDSSQETE